MMDISSIFRGITTPIRELYQQIEAAGWQISKAKFDNKRDQFVVEGKGPHGDKIERWGPNDKTAVANLLLAITRHNFIRTAAQWKVGMWRTMFTDQLQPIAEAYANAPIYDPKAAGAFKSLAQDSVHRAQVLGQQIQIEVVDNPEPYKSAQEMSEDIHKKRHFYVSRSNSEHPVWTIDENVAFRTVHDVLGHAVSGGDFGWQGENLACAAHFPLLNPTAQQALFTECIAQTAYAAYYRSFGPQKVALFPDFIEGPVAQENQPGHTGVHPSQSVAPTKMPQVAPSEPAPTPFQPGSIAPHQEALGLTPVFTAESQFVDPNHQWDSGIQPTQPNAYLDWNDPLESDQVIDNASKINTDWHQLSRPEMKQAIVNAFRVVLLSPQKNLRWNAIHYQDLAQVPADVDDPKAYWDRLEQSRQDWNVKRFGEGSRYEHKPYGNLLPAFYSLIYQSNPDLGPQGARQKADRILFEWTEQEQNKIIYEKQGKDLDATDIENKANKALAKRLKVFLDQSQERMDVLAANQQVMYHVAPKAAREQIAHQGLQARAEKTMPGQEAGVYLWPDLDSAQEWAASPSLDADVYEVQVNPQQLYEDEAYGMGAAYTPQPIEPNRIKRIAKTAMAWDFKTCPECQQPLSNPNFCDNCELGPSEPSPGQGVLYHGSKNPDLDTQGIRANQPSWEPDQVNGVYLAESPEGAKHWGPNIYEVDVNGLPLHTDFYSEDSSVHPGDIPAERVKRIAKTAAKWQPNQIVYTVDGKRGIVLDNEAMHIPGLIEVMWHDGSTSTLSEDRLRIDRTSADQQSFDIDTPEVAQTPKVLTDSAKYQAFIGTHLKQIAQVSQYADEILEAALEDVHDHDGTGHHFRSKVMQLNIPGVGPKVASFAWLLLQPLTSQLGTIDSHMMAVLGYPERAPANKRDYFRLERELQAGRDAAGYSHIPLGTFQWGMWDNKRTGPGSHQDHSAMRVINPVDHNNIDWASHALKSVRDWQAPDWWEQTRPARQAVAEDWQNTVAPNYPGDQIPFQKVAGSLWEPAKWEPGYSGKGLVDPRGKAHAWIDDKLESYSGPHHAEYMAMQLPHDVIDPSTWFFIDKDGNVDSGGREGLAQERIEQAINHHPQLKMAPDRWSFSKLAAPSEDEFHVGIDIPEEGFKRIADWVNTLEWPKEAELEDPKNYHITIFWTDKGYKDKELHDWIESYDVSGLPVESADLDQFPSTEKPYDAIVLKFSGDELQEIANRVMDDAEERELDFKRFPGGYKAHVTIGWAKEKPKGPEAKISFRTGPLYVSIPRPLRKESDRDDTGRGFQHWWNQEADKVNPGNIDTKARKLAEYAVGTWNTKKEATDFLKKHKDDLDLSDSDYKKFKKEFLEKFEDTMGHHSRISQTRYRMQQLREETGLTTPEIWQQYPDDDILSEDERSTHPGNRTWTPLPNEERQR